MKADSNTEDEDFAERGASALRAMPREVVQRVLQKFSRMSETLVEIEDWLDSRDASWAAAVAPPTPGRVPLLTYDSLDDAIRRDEGYASD